MSISKILKSLSLVGCLCVVFAILITALLSVILPMYKNAVTIGNSIGTAEGTAVGRVTGSYRGITKGISDAKNDVIIHPEVSVTLASQLEQCGRLEVLVAGVKLTNCHSVGEKYQALYLVKGEAVFSVDLQKAVIYKANDGSLIVRLPQPEMELFIDERETQKLAEDGNKFFDGSFEDGFVAYLNSMSNTVSNITNTLSNYEELREQARNSAEKQVAMIVTAVCENSTQFIVEFDS